MPLEDLNFGSRLALAFSLPFRVLFSGSLAARIAELDARLALPPLQDDAQVAPKEESEPVRGKLDEPIAAVEPEVDFTPALQLLSILQREGRFVDFIQEDMSGFGDEEIGAAARVVQDGCKRGLAEYIDIGPIRNEADGEQVTLEPGYDAYATRVTGNVSGKPPFSGTLAHHGWKATRVRLPELSAEHDARVLAPAEVEV